MHRTAGGGQVLSPLKMYHFSRPTVEMQMTKLFKSFGLGLLVLVIAAVGESELLKL
jgi:hypothetical protein